MNPTDGSLVASAGLWRPSELLFKLNEPPGVRSASDVGDRKVFEHEPCAAGVNLATTEHRNRLAFGSMLCS
jgi:hypothetical protein